MVSGVLGNEVLPVRGLEFSRRRRVRTAGRPAACGAGKVSADEQDWGSLGAVVTGLGDRGRVRRARGQELPRRTARRLLAGAGADEDSGQSR
jgi:hypothetical protein